MLDFCITVFLSTAVFRKTYLDQQFITIIANKSFQILHSYFHLYGMQEQDIKIVLSIITLRKKITESNAVKL